MTTITPTTSQNADSVYQLRDEIESLSIETLSLSPDDQYTKIVHGTINLLNQKIKNCKVFSLIRYVIHPLAVNQDISQYEKELNQIKCTLSILKEVKTSRELLALQKKIS
jgi:hypothetical protein